MKENVVKNAEFYAELSKKTEIDEATCEKVMKGAEQLIIEYLAADKTVQFYRFGKYYSSFRKGFTTQSKFVDSAVEVQDHYLPSFKPAEAVSDAINEKKYPERYRPSNK